MSGYQYIEIFNHIKKEGYGGSISLHNSKIKGIRWEAGQKIRYLKRSDIKKLLYRPPEALEVSRKRKDIEQYLKGQPEIKKYWSLCLNLKHS